MRQWLSRFICGLEKSPLENRPAILYNSLVFYHKSFQALFDNSFVFSCRCEYYQNYSSNKYVWKHSMQFIIIYYLCVWVFLLKLYFCTISVPGSSSGRMALDFLKLQLLKVIGHHVIRSSARVKCVCCLSSVSLAPLINFYYYLYLLIFLFAFYFFILKCY